MISTIGRRPTMAAPSAAPSIAFSEIGRVEHAVAELVGEPAGDAEHAAGRGHVLAEHDRLRVGLHRPVQRGVERRPVRDRRCLLRRRHAAPAVAGSAAGASAAASRGGAHVRARGGLELGQRALVGEALGQDRARAAWGSGRTRRPTRAFSPSGRYCSGSCVWCPPSRRAVATTSVGPPPSRARDGCFEHRRADDARVGAVDGDAGESVDRRPPLERPAGRHRLGRRVLGVAVVLADEHHRQAVDRRRSSSPRARRPG